jgi:DNA polymerase II small subunit/DNA polymerase delta subunit B
MGKESGSSVQKFFSSGEHDPKNFCEKHRIPGYCYLCTGEKRQEARAEKERSLTTFRFGVRTQVDKSAESVFVKSKGDGNLKKCPHDYPDAQDCHDCVSRVEQLKQDFFIKLENLNEKLEGDYWSRISEDGCDSRVEYEKEVREELQNYEDEIAKIHKEFFE